MKSLTGSSARAGATFVLLMVPSLLSPLGGYVVDRVRRRPFLVAVNALSALMLLPLLLVHDDGDVPIIYAVTYAYGVSLALHGGALNGLLKALLPEQALAEANGALQTVQQGSRLVAPLIGAGVFAAAGGAFVAMLDALTFPRRRARRRRSVPGCSCGGWGARGGSSPTSASCSPATSCSGSGCRFRPSRSPRCCSGARPVS